MHVYCMVANYIAESAPGYFVVRTLCSTTYLGGTGPPNDPLKEAGTLRAYLHRPYPQQ
jgi:hypothetical protein